MGVYWAMWYFAIPTTSALHTKGFRSERERESVRLPVAFQASNGQRHRSFLSLAVGLTHGLGA
ncbi:MAG: hypothetical protein ACI8X5_003848 [Planctomycetota bacterium]|jgi:hypothetical protein